MKTTIAVTVLIVIDDEDQAKPPAANRNPLDDLIEGMRHEMSHGRDSVNWRKVDGPKVA